ncbi:hypothetical protein RB594_002514 [Gaeumannomyces avenae]
MDDGHSGDAPGAASEAEIPSNKHPCENLRFDGIWQIKPQAGASAILGCYRDMFPRLKTLFSLRTLCEVCKSIHMDFWTTFCREANIDAFTTFQPEFKGYRPELPAEITYSLAYVSSHASQPPCAHGQDSAAIQGESPLHLELCIDVNVEATPFNKSHFRRTYQISPVDDDLASWLSVEPLQPFLSANDISLVQSAIVDCERDHERCRPRTSETFFPTRLIDLGARGPASNPTLVVTAQSPRTSSNRKYATLSYCWGSSSEAASQLTTTRETFTQRSNGIPLNTMPNVVQDAIAVCHAIGIRYLWVDALCILQDDREDWARESELMGKVYAHSYLTVCAANSNSCRQPFLQRVHASSKFLAFRSETYPHLDSKRMLFQGRLHKGEVGGRWGNIPGFLDSKWFDRGWVLQERLLPLRCLVFKDQLFINCNDRIISGAGGNVDDNVQGEMTITGVIDKTKRILEHHRRPVWLAARFWDDIVMNSTSLELTNPNDRLPSLAGLAQQFGAAMEFLPSDYLAGLWMPFLPTSLLWLRLSRKYRSIAERLEALRSPRSSGAASWSPLSLDGTKSLGTTQPGISLNGHIRTECESIKGAATANGSNWYATSTGARLTVTARAIHMPLDLRGLSHDMWARRVTKDGRCAAYCYFDFDETEPSPFGENTLLLLLCSPRSGGSADLYDWADGTKLDDDGDDVTLTENIRRVKSEYSQYAPEQLDDAIPPMEECLLCQTPGLNRRAWGLVLYPAGEENVYYRIGMFMSRAREAGGTALFSGSQNRTLEII